MAVRKGQLMAMAKVDEVIKRALADPTINSPISAALAELTPLVDAVGKNRSQEDPEWYQEGGLRNDIQNLRSMQKAEMTITEREYLTRYVEEQEKRIALMLPQCEIAKTSPTEQK
jgi:hypothetical protein